MSGNRSLFHKLSCLVLGLVLVIAVSMTAVANDKTSSSRECLDTLNVGVTVTGGKSAEGSGSTASSRARKSAVIRHRFISVPLSNVMLGKAPSLRELSARRAD